MDRYYFFEEGFNEEFQRGQKTFKVFDIEKLKNSKETKYQIPLKYNYRPDLISKDVYGDKNLWWVLVEYNRFKNSPEDFKSTATILVPDKNKVYEVLSNA